MNEPTEKLQLFEIPEFLKQFQYYYSIFDGTAYICYISLSKIGKADACEWIYEHYRDSNTNLSREDFTHLVEEEFVDEVFTRVEQIRLNALKR